MNIRCFILIVQCFADVLRGSLQCVIKSNICWKQNISFPIIHTRLKKVKKWLVRNVPNNFSPDKFNGTCIWYLLDLKIGREQFLESVKANSKNGLKRSIVRTMVKHFSGYYEKFEFNAESIALMLKACAQDIKHFLRT